MATPQDAVPVLEETPVKVEREFAFVPPELTYETYLHLIADRFKSRKDSKKVGCCPYDTMVSVIRAQIGNDFYVFEEEPDMFSKSVNARVWRNESDGKYESDMKEEALLARLTVFFPSGHSYEGGRSGVAYTSVPSVTVHEQRCSDAALAAILKNIAPQGLEARIVEKLPGQIL